MNRELAFIRDKETGKLVDVHFYTEETSDFIESLLAVCDVEIVDVNKLYEENKQLKVQVAELEKWKAANHPTGICETCTDRSVQLNTEYKRVLQKASKVLNYYENVVQGETPMFDQWTIEYQDASGRELATIYTPATARELNQEIKTVLHPFYLDSKKKF